MVLLERDGAVWRAWVSLFRTYPGFRSCTAADKFVSFGPDQSRDLTSVSSHHTAMLLCLVAWSATCVCVVSLAEYHKRKGKYEFYDKQHQALFASLYLCIFILECNCLLSPAVFHTHKMSMHTHIRIHITV